MEDGGGGGWVLASPKGRALGRGWPRPHWEDLGGSGKPASVVRVLGVCQKAGVCLRKAAQVQGAAFLCHLGIFEAMDAGPPSETAISLSNLSHKQAGFRTTGQGFCHVCHRSHLCLILYEHSHQPDGEARAQAGKVGLTPASAALPLAQCCPLCGTAVLDPLVALVCDRKTCKKHCDSCWASLGLCGVRR